MATEPKTIHVTDGGELARLIEAANTAPVILERDGIRYRLSREEDGPWVNYDPEAVLAPLRAVGGTLSPEEGEELKAYLLTRNRRHFERITGLRLYEMS